MYVYMYVCLCMYTYMPICVGLSVYMCIYVCIFACLCMSMCVCVSIRVCVSIWTTTLPIVRTRMDMEGTTLNEIIQMGETNTVWYHLYVESKKMSDS